MQAVQRRTDIRPCFRSRSDTSSCQDTSRYRTDIQFGTQTVRRSRCSSGVLCSINFPIGIHLLLAIAAALL